MRILVAHASRHGSTADVAASVAATLRGRDVDVDVRPAGEVESLAGYYGVVLGVGVSRRRWHRGARRFARAFESDLAKLPVAVFAVGPAGDTVPDAPRFTPFASAVFGGSGDWDAVRRWAIGVADGFETPPTWRAA